MMMSKNWEPFVEPIEQRGCALGVAPNCKVLRTLAADILDILWTSIKNPFSR
jgi:hypothetical protein